MTLEDHIELIQMLSEQVDKSLRESIVLISDKYGMGVAASVATNVGTTLCAIAACTTENEQHLKMVIGLTQKVIEEKARDGAAQLETMIAIHKAKEHKQ